jgi:TonB family protein
MNRRLRSLLLTLLPAIALGQSSEQQYREMQRSIALTMPIAVRIVLAKPDIQRGPLPTPISQALPEFPIELRSARVPGEAQIGLTVEADGRVTSLRIVRETLKEFGEAAIIAARTWRFAPARTGAGSVAASVEYNVLFDLPLGEGEQMLFPWGKAPKEPMGTPSLRSQQARNEAARPLFDAAVVKRLVVGDTLENAKNVLRGAGVPVDQKQNLLSVFSTKYRTGEGCGYSLYLSYDTHERISKIEIMEFISGP